MSLEITEEFLLLEHSLGYFTWQKVFSIWFSLLLEKGREMNPALYLISLHGLFLKELKSEGWVLIFVTVWLRDSSSTTLLWHPNPLNRELLRLVSFQWSSANWWNVEEYGMNFRPVIPNNSFFSFLYCWTLKEGAGHLKSGPLPDCSMLNYD